MRRDYTLVNGSLQLAEPGQAVTWTDLFAPDRTEEAALEEVLGIDLPTRDDMVEIVTSSRIYSEGGALYLTATVPAQMETNAPMSGPVSFVLAPDRLVTIRYHSPRAFDEFPQAAARTRGSYSTPTGLMLALLEAIVDRLADILETESRALDDISREIFPIQTKTRRKPGRLQSAIGRIGRMGELDAIIQDSLQTLERMVGHLAQFPIRRLAAPERRDQAQALLRDIQSLVDYSGALSQRTSFLLSATLGMVGLEQNEIIKFFSVVSVIFLPPTLVGTVYGMNFQTMPELAHPYGYAAALGAMLVTALAPYLWFKWRGWF